MNRPKSAIFTRTSNDTLNVKYIMLHKIFRSLIWYPIEQREINLPDYKIVGKFYIIIFGGLHIFFDIVFWFLCDENICLGPK